MVGVKEFRQNMSQISQQALKNNQKLIILRKNEPIFELKPINKKEDFLNKLIIDVNESIEDLKNSRVYSQKEMKNFFGID